MTTLRHFTVGTLGDYYTIEEHRVLDGVQLAWGGVDGGGQDKHRQPLPPIDHRIVGLDFKWGARIRVYQVRDELRWRIDELAWSMGALTAYGRIHERALYDAWTVKRNTPLEVEFLPQEGSDSR
jgi:hypothetical protein